MELNPNHPVTRAVSDHWHKIAAILMMKFGVKEIVISDADIATMPNDIVIAIEEKKDHFKIWLTDMKTAETLARKEGGLPI